MASPLLFPKPLRLLTLAMAVLRSWLACADPGLGSSNLREQAAIDPPAPTTSFRGVVCFASAPRNQFFLQEGTTAVHVRPGVQADFEPGVGQLVQAEGTLVQGYSGAQLTATRLRLLGEAPLPAPLQVEYDQMAAGTVDYRYCQFAGVVRSVQESRPDGLLGLEVAGERGRVTALLNNYHLGDCRKLVDAEILVTGICVREPDTRQRLKSIELLVSGMGGIALATPAPADPFSVPACPLPLLSQPGTSLLHRVKVSGTVSLYQPGNCFYLENEPGGLRVESRQSTALRSGDIVEVLGFVSGQRSIPSVLEDAMFRKIGTRTNFIPFRASPQDLQDPACLGRWVEVDAHTVSPGRQPKLNVGNLTLALNFLSEPLPPPVPSGTLLRVKGVLVQNPEGHLGLTLRSAADIQRLSTGDSHRPVLVGVALLIAFVTIVALLRRRRRVAVTD